MMLRSVLPSLFVASLVPLLAAACSSSDAGGSTPSLDASAGPDGRTGSPVDDGGAFPSECPRTAKAADRTRKVVVSHPFGEGGAKTKAFEVLDLSQTGELTRINETFTMGNANAEIAFTPDGEVGLVAQTDGSIGVFAFDAAGKARVVHEGFTGDFSAGHIVVSRDGSRAFIVDPNTMSNGGGVHEVRIGCDGSLTYVGLVIPGGKAHAMALLPTDPDRAVLIAGAAFDSAPADYAHRIDFAAAKPQRLASGAVFGDSDAIASWVAITPDGKWALVTDNGILKGNRMAPIAVDTMKAAPTLAVTNPAAVVMSPFGNAALLLEADGEDALKVVRYDASSTQAPFSVGAEIAYKSGKVELPYLAMAIDRGTLKGRVLVAENQAIRQLAFAEDGSIADVGILKFEGFTGIVGSLGVQP